MPRQPILHTRRTVDTAPDTGRADTYISAACNTRSQRKVRNVFGSADSGLTQSQVHTASKWIPRSHPV
jgi:hypothetical protein